MDKKSRDFVMGKLYLKNKDYKMAEKSFSEYLSSNPEDYQALKMSAQVQEHLHDTAKAFDHYQRCYLSQPDRKAVLLDICRLLLFNDPRLEHVDQKKWLRLAAQAFPTNPIVTNLRESLPTNQESHPGRISTEDLIMEKLTLLEDRFKNFEDGFKTFEDRFVVFDERFKNFEDGIKSVEGKFTSFENKFQKIEDKFSSFDSRFKTIEDKLTSFGGLLNSIQNGFKKSTEQPKSSNTQPTSFLDLSKSSENRQDNLGSKLETLSIKSTEPANQPAMFNPPILFGSSLSKPVDTNVSYPAVYGSHNIFGNLADKPVDFAATKTPTSNSSSLFAPIPFNPSLNFGFKSSTEKSDAAPKLDSVNLWAEGLKKMNVPTEGSWVTQHPQKDEPKEAAKENGDGEEGGDNDDDGGVVPNEELPIENTCDMRPIEIKTGEEDEDIVFKHRCKLFRFRDKEYKERGLGDIKVLKHKETGAGRLIMRREMINLVCLNCWSCKNIERVRDTQVRFAGFDASDGDAELTVFLAKFKTPESTDEFMKHLKDLFTED